jgi:hypothetical protein
MANEVCLKDNILYYFTHIPLLLNSQEVIFYSNNPNITHKNSTKNINKIQLSFEIKIGIKCNRLHYFSEYNMKIINKILEFRNKGMYYKDISNYFIGNGYMGIRNGKLEAKLVERLEKKYLKSISNRRIKFIEFSEMRFIIFK